MLDAVGQSNAAAWMDHFRLQSIDTSANPAVATIAPTMAFAGGAANVATGPRLQRVADTITSLLGRPVRAQLAAVAPRPGQADTHSPAEAGPNQANTNSGDRGGGAGGGVDRRDALNLPLVRDVFEIFPDASLIDARKEKPRPPAEDDPPAQSE
ncbi:MAG: hypothetical protein AAF593_15625 [Planctomycetota bacterium]